MDPESKVFRRQRFGLVFSLNFQQQHKPASDETQSRISEAVSRLPWSFFSACDVPCKNWKWAEVVNGVLPADSIQNCFNAAPMDVVVDGIHRLLDTLPPPNTFLFDIFCICDQIPSKTIPATLYGLLSRATSWHGASLNVVARDAGSGRSFFSDLSADVWTVDDFCQRLPGDSGHRNVFWRGDVSFFDDSEKQFVDMSAFELSGNDSFALATLESQLHKNKKRLLSSGTDRRANSKRIVSRRLKVISRCNLSTVPPFYLTKARFSLRSLHSWLADDECIRSVLGLATHSMGLIARIDSSPASKTSSSFMDSASSRGEKSRLDTDHWKKWVLNGMQPDEAPQSDAALSDKPLEPVFFLIFDSNSSAGERSCVLLDANANGGQIRGFDVIHDVLMRDTTAATFQPDLPTFRFSADVSRLKRSLEMIRQKTVATVAKENPDMSKEELSTIFDSLMDEAIKQVMPTVDVMADVVSSSEVVASSDLKNNDQFVDDVGWEEKRFLALLDHYNHILAERKQKSSGDEGPMQPSGNFVVMEAKELVKLFDDDGNARTGTPLQPIPSPTSQSLTRDEKVGKDFVASVSNWPALLWTEFPDLYYNRDEKSEVRDRELSKLQQIYVGAKETVSTCNSLNASKDPEVISKPTSSQQQQQQFSKNPEASAATAAASTAARAGRAVVDKSRPRFTASVLRKSPRKLPAHPRHQMAPPSAASAKTQDEVFRQKLRNAVYSSLASRGIDETSPLFRPCFKRLFDICKMYANDIPAKVKNGGGTKRWLLDVAQRNAVSVIELEKSYI